MERKLITARAWINGLKEREMLASLGGSYKIVFICSTSADSVRS